MVPRFVGNSQRYGTHGYDGISFGLAMDVLEILSIRRGNENQIGKGNQSEKQLYSFSIEQVDCAENVKNTLIINK